VKDVLALVVRQINAAHGTAFVLGERFRRGEQGAFRLRDARGDGYVLKWQPGASDLRALPAEATVFERLRSMGYPIPRYVAWGVLDTPAGRYTVQELLPGQSAWGLGGQALEDALALNDLQAGAAAPLLEPGPSGGGAAYEPWRSLILRLALEGGDGFCHLEAMRAYSPETAALLAHVQEYIASRAPLLDSRPAYDVVHFDFGGPNILVDEGRVTGVVDWGPAPLPGDRTFDLATLLFYDGYYADVPATRARIWERALELVDAETFGLYLCHMIHRQTDWSIRHHDAAEVPRVLAVCRSVLRDLAVRTGRQGNTCGA
jgi:hypothetical protein